MGFGSKEPQDMLDTIIAGIALAVAALPAGVVTQRVIHRLAPTAKPAVAPASRDSYA